MRVYLPTALRARILAAAGQAAQVEVCGLLVGRIHDDVWVDDVVMAENVAATPHKRFEIDPQLQFDTMRKLRGGEHVIVGHFHSHPDGPAEPSTQDLAMAIDPEAIWVIAALKPEPKIAAFICRDQGQGFQALEVI